MPNHKYAVELCKKQTEKPQYNMYKLNNGRKLHHQIMVTCTYHNACLPVNLKYVYKHYQSRKDIPILENKTHNMNIQLNAFLQQTRRPHTSLVLKDTHVLFN